MHPDFAEAAGVEQLRDALARRQLALRVVARHLFFAAERLGALAKLRELRQFAVPLARVGLRLVDCFDCHFEMAP